MTVAELEGLVELHTLELSSNCLPAVRCASLLALEELWLSDNQMTALEHIDEITGAQGTATRGPSVATPLPRAHGPWRLLTSVA